MDETITHDRVGPLLVQGCTYFVSAHTLVDVSDCPHAHLHLPLNNIPVICDEELRVGQPPGFSDSYSLDRKRAWKLLRCDHWARLDSSLQIRGVVASERRVLF
jgi:hypothetical protein